MSEEQNSAAVEVLPVDREAAKRLGDALSEALTRHGFQSHFEPDDNGGITQAFAIHRLASTPPPVAAGPVGEVERLRERVRVLAGNDIAKADWIERLEAALTAALSLAIPHVEQVASICGCGKSDCGSTDAMADLELLRAIAAQQQGQRNENR